MIPVKKPNCLIIIMTIYICTIFIYNDFGIRMYLGYLFLIISLILIIIQQPRIQLTKSHIAFLLIIGAVLLAYLRPTARFDKDVAAYTVSMLICFCYVLSAKMSASEFVKIEKIFLNFATIFAIVVIISRIALDFYLKTFYKLLIPETQIFVHDSLWHGYGSPIGGDDTFHNYIFMFATMFSLGHIVESTHKWKSYYFRTLFFIIASFLTGRRGEFITLFIVWLITNIYLMPKKQRVLLFKIGIFLVITVIPFIPMIINSPLVSRYAITFKLYKAGSDFFGGRFELWEEAFKIFLEHPILGIGWGGFSNYVTDAFRAAHGQNVFNVHNIYLQFLAETGIIGTSFILLGLLTIYINTLKQTINLRKIKVSTLNLKKLNSVSLGVQTYFLIIGFIDPCFMKHYYWFFFSIAFLMMQFVNQSIYEQRKKLA